MTFIVVIGTLNAFVDAIMLIALINSNGNLNDKLTDAFILISFLFIFISLVYIGLKLLPKKENEK